VGKKVLEFRVRRRSAQGRQKLEKNHAVALSRRRRVNAKKAMRISTECRAREKKLLSSGYKNSRAKRPAGSETATQKAFCAWVEARENLDRNLRLGVKKIRAVSENSSCREENEESLPEIRGKKKKKTTEEEER